MTRAPAYRAAVIGAGRGGGQSLRAIAESDRYQLVAVCDRLPAVRAEISARFGRRIATYDDYTEMLERNHLDVVCIATYPPSHEEIALRTMQSGVSGLLVEKPLSTSSISGSRILNEAQRRGLPIAVPHGLVTLGATQQTQALIRSGAIGRVRLIEIVTTGMDLLNAGVHWIHFCIVLLEPDNISSVLAACDTSSRTFRDGVQVETESIVLARTQNGIRIILNSGDSIPTCSSSDVLIRVVGDDGVIELFGWEGRFRVLAAGRPNGDVKVANPPVAFHRAYLELLASQLDNGRPDYTGPQQSLAALEVCEAAYLSHELQRTVTLPIRSTNAHLVNKNWTLGSPYPGHGGGRDGRALDAGGRPQ